MAGAAVDFTDAFWEEAVTGAGPAVLDRLAAGADRAGLPAGVFLGGALLLGLRDAAGLPAGRAGDGFLGVLVLLAGGCFWALLARPAVAAGASLAWVEALALITLFVPPLGVGFAVTFLAAWAPEGLPLGLLAALPVALAMGLVDLALALAVGLGAGLLAGLALGLDAGLAAALAGLAAVTGFFAAEGRVAALAVLLALEVAGLAVLLLNVVSSSDGAKRRPFMGPGVSSSPFDRRIRAYP